MDTKDTWATPFERGNGNQTTTWADCIAFHLRLAQAHPQWLRFDEAGRSDGGVPIHAGVFSADGDFDPVSVKAAGRPVFFNNNGIHPGEPEGIDACMALLRDLCLDPSRRAALGRTVLLFIPAYNVDGMLNRGDSSRVNQLGPEAFGFRGNARHLDLNRDFIKADSRNARTFAQLFTRWDPDVMVDTHTSNGADYQPVMTLIATQPDKLGGRTGEHLREQMLPALYAAMEARGFPMCPYVNPLKETPDDGLSAMLDTPRFSTGYAALHHCIGFMPETHMLKPFEARYRSTRALLDAALAHTTAHGDTIRAARAADRAAVASGSAVPLEWQLDMARSRPIRFSGFQAVHEPSRLGSYQRLRYDRSAPWVKDIDYHDRYQATTTVTPPRAYLLPQAWHDVAERLRAHGLPLQAIQRPGRVAAQAWRIDAVDKRGRPFEGRHLHDSVQAHLEDLQADVAAGDWLLPLGGSHDRLAIETLEPQGADSFFRWAFFDSVLDKKEGFSDYAFEDEAERLLATEPGLAQRFDAWKAAHPGQLHDPQAVLGFIFLAAGRYNEPAWRRYPVLRLAALPTALLVLGVDAAAGPFRMARMLETPTPYARKPGLPSVGLALALMLAYMAATVAVQMSSGIPYTDWFRNAANAWRTGVLSLLAGSLLLVVAVLVLRWNHFWRDPQRLPVTRVMKLAFVAWWLAIVLRLAGIRWAEVPVSLLAAIVASGVLVGFAEETLFRGFVLRGLREGGRPESRAAVWTAVAFGLFHLPNVFMGTGVLGLVQILLAGSSGLVLYAFRRQGGLLWPAMLAHGSWDISTFLAGSYPQEWLTPVSLGLQLAVTVLGLAIGVGLLRHDRTTVALPQD